MLGVNIQANLDTQSSVPYLTHQDFIRNIKDLTDFCDDAVINLCNDKSSSGLKQYFNNDAALDKLLKSAVDARNSQLGRLAAFEYEQVTEDFNDYTSSIKRFYQRNSLVSTLNPMMLLVQIKLDDLTKSK